MALVAGTAWGQDDHFPFGPFRMYSTTTPASGNVRSALLEGVTVEGTTVEVDFGAIGLRRAEIEGQLPRFEEDPDLLAVLARAYHELNPNEPDLVELRLVQVVQPVRRHEVLGKDTIARWERP